MKTNFNTNTIELPTKSESGYGFTAYTLNEKQSLFVYRRDSSWLGKTKVWLRAEVETVIDDAYGNSTEMLAEIPYEYKGFYSDEDLMPSLEELKSKVASMLPEARDAEAALEYRNNKISSYYGHGGYTGD